ncbi:MAG: ATP-binding cassette domain-containing protein, partial [Rubripirellula sp.]|nr:ATP-binding cassette domain-containing protein [Rubripirellula sp.]
MTSTSAKTATPQPRIVSVVRNLHHRYGDSIALDGVELEVRSGEILALLGPNGSGKSTLFRLLSTLMPIQQGVIEVAGISAAEQYRHVLAWKGAVSRRQRLTRQLSYQKPEL